MIIIPPALNHELLSCGLPDCVHLVGGRQIQLIGLIFKASSINIFFLKCYLFIVAGLGLRRSGGLSQSR